MKKSNLFLVLGLIGSMLFSCSEREMNLVVNNDSAVVDSLYLQGYVFPLSKAYQAMHPATRSGETSFETDWENKTEIYTFTGEKANLPWADVTDPNIPLEIAKDVKKQDGWQMLFHTFANTPGSTRDLNYIILYNIRTGVLKVFYYKETTPQANNTGIWKLSFTNPHHMFNAVKDFPLPAEMGTDTNWTTTNFVKNETKGFVRGWNCFQILLTYDPNENTSNRQLEITTHNLNQANIDLFCNLAGYSQGAVITHGSSNPLSKISTKLATLAGKQAEKWINDNMGSKVNAESKSAILAMGASAIVKKGLNKLFDNFTATLTKPTETRADLQFTTTTTGSIGGTFSFASTSPVMGLRTLFSEDIVGGKLGAWNLKATPSVYIDPRAGHDPSRPGMPYYKFFGSTQYVYDLEINPRLAPYIIKKWTDIDVIENDSAKFPANFPHENFNCGNMANMGRVGLDIQFNKNNKFRPEIFTSGKTLPAVFIDKTSIYGERTFSVQTFALRVTLNLVTEIEGKRDTTVSTRTFIPKVEWDPVTYNRLKNVDFSQFTWYSCPPDLFE